MAHIEISKRPVAAPASRLRVLHIINDLGLGGAETLLYRLATLPSTVEHRIVSLGPRQWYSKMLEEQGVAVEYFDMKSPFAMARGILCLRRLIRQCRPDVVQCWLYRSNVLGGLAGRMAGVPVSWSIHCSSLTPLKYSSRALVYLSALLAPFVPAYIINCSKKSAELHARLGYSAVPGAVIHNGYDPDRFWPDADSGDAMRNGLGIGPGDFVIGSVARWHPQKDIPNFLRAVRLAHDRGVALRAFVIGAGLGADNADLAEEISRADCGELVIPLGPRTDIEDITRALDLHVLASCGAEAFPNAVAETMLAGTPNAVTDIGDSAMMVGDSGWVVPPRNPEKLADAIEQAWREWKEQPAAWEARRNAARVRIADNFTLERMAQAYEDVWRNLASGRPHPAHSARDR